MNSATSIGTRLREERQRLKFSQTDLGRAGGVLKQAQLKYEQGKRVPDAVYLQAVAQAGVDIRYVLVGVRTDQELRTAHRDLIAAYDRATPDGAQLLGLAAKLAAHPTKARAALGVLMLVEALG